MDLDSLSILLLSESLDIDSLISLIIENPIFEFLFILIIILLFIVLLIIILNDREERMKHKKRQRISHHSNNSRGTYRRAVGYATTQTRTNDQNDSYENNEQEEYHEDANISRESKDIEINNVSESFCDEIKNTPKEIVEPIIISRQKDVIQSFIMLTVKNGLFVEADPCGVCYYRTWTANGKKYFEFVNNDRTKKAINNRSILIEPFCIKMEKSISPDEADMIETIEPGILSDDYTVIEKAKIIYK